MTFSNLVYLDKKIFYLCVLVAVPVLVTVVIEDLAVEVEVEVEDVVVEVAGVIFSLLGGSK